MPKAATTVRKPRKALGDVSGSASNQELPTVERPKSNKTAAPKETSSKRTNEPPSFVTEVILPGEERNAVPVFDDCRTLRRKVNAYLATGVKKTHFLKWIGGSSPVALKNFLSRSGIMDGANLDIYYQLYVFFEKKRVFEDKQKTELRIKQEKAFPRGRDVQALKRTHLWLFGGETTDYDELGRLVIISEKGKRRVLD